MTHTAFTLQEVHDAATFVQTGTDMLAAWLHEFQTEKGRCLLALSGGSTPAPFYQALAARHDIAWKHVTRCLVDERVVPANDEQSNARLVRDTMPVESPELFPDTTLSFAACADDYERRLLAAIGNGPLDIAVLGMGEDGHIASLFPPVTDEGLTRMGVVHTVTDRFAVYNRIGMALPLLERAARRLLLLQGDRKMDVFRECLAAKEDRKRWPLHALLDDRLTVLCLA